MNLHGLIGRKGWVLDKTMLKNTLVLLSAYTSYSFVPQGHVGDIHAKIEEALGRPVWTHEMANEKLWKEVRTALLPEVRKLIDVAFSEEGNRDVD